VNNKNPNQSPKSPIWASAIINWKPLLTASGEFENAAAVGGTKIGNIWLVPRKTPDEMHVVRNNPPVIERDRMNRINTSIPKKTASATAPTPSNVYDGKPSLGAVLPLVRPVFASQNMNIANIASMMNSQKNSLVENRVLSFSFISYSVATSIVYANVEKLP
jgi:hypothetical protein